jgi:hypothetical protein
MSLSDKIVLGSTFVKLNPSRWYSRGCGCLIGMGMAADESTLFFSQDADMQEELILQKYPWLALCFRPPVLPQLPPFALAILRGAEVLPPEHPFNKIQQWQSARALDIISYMAYLVKHGSMTLEEAVDWIRSVEPQEPQPDAQQQSENTLVAV